MTKISIFKRWETVLFGVALLASIQSSAADYYVDAANGNDATNAGTSLATAKATIQAGVDACAVGDTVWITDGTYVLSSAIVVDKAITIQSLSGPEAVLVDGGGSNRCFNLGGAACTLSGLTIANGYDPYLYDDYNNSTGGGIYCTSTTPMVTNCTFSGNSVAYYGGGMYGGTAYNCTFIGNSAAYIGGGMYRGTAYNCTFIGNSSGGGGGGMYGGTAYNCTFIGNSANTGGGMSDGTATNCIFTGNSASEAGGGMLFGTANHCIFTGNSANDAGGMYDGTANNCTFIGNSSAYIGGGMFDGTANNCSFNGNSAEEGGGMAYGAVTNCTFTENSSAYIGGGMIGGTANYCTFTGNSAEEGGGGMFASRANNCTFSWNSAYVGGGMQGGRANNCTFSENSARAHGGGMAGLVFIPFTVTAHAKNCIVWNNTAGISGDDLHETAATNSCSPDVTQGNNGCITNEPAFIDRSASNFRLALTSPCIDAGDNAYVIGSVDLDGSPRIVNGTVDMGAYEYDGALYDSDGDAVNDYVEYVADTAAMDSNDWFHITSISNGTVHFRSSETRLYTLLWSTNIIDGIWEPITNRMGTGGEDSMNGSYNLPAGYFKVEVENP